MLCLSLFYITYPKRIPKVKCPWAYCLYVIEEITVAETDDAKLTKVKKAVAGKGTQTVYTISEQQSNAFGVQWTQVDHFDHEGDARVAFQNYE